MLKNLLLIGCTFLLFMACSEDAQEEETNEMEDVVDTGNETLVTYDTDIAPLIASRCFTCHGTPTDQGAPFSLDTYDSLIIDTDVTLYTLRGSNGRSIMPPSDFSDPLPEEEIALFEQWIEDGLLEN